MNVATICRTLHFMGCSRQVIKHIPVQHSEEMRAKFMAEISVYDPSMLLSQHEKLYLLSDHI